LKTLRDDPVGAAFSIGAGAFKRFVYQPIVANPAPNHIQQRFTKLRAGAALMFVQQRMSRVAQLSKHSSAVSSLSSQFSSLASRALAMRTTLLKGEKPTADLQSYLQSLRSMATTLKGRGIKLFLPASF
jgi:hypothetical protein